MYDEASDPPNKWYEEDLRYDRFTRTGSRRWTRTYSKYLSWDGSWVRTNLPLDQRWDEDSTGDPDIDAMLVVLACEQDAVRNVKLNEEQGNVFSGSSALNGELSLAPGGRGMHYRRKK